MRATNLVRVAAEAEVLRIQHMLKRQGIRAAFGVAALIFAVGVLVLVNIACWQLARLYVSAIDASLIMLGANLVIAVIFGLLAARSSPSRTEREALDLRQRALAEARGSLALGALVPVAGALLRSRRGGGPRRSFWRRSG
jgi:hypothetical protein